MADSTPTPTKYLTHADLLSLLNEHKGSRQLDDFASEVGVSSSLMSNILCGYRKAHGSKVLKYLGVKKVTMYAFIRGERK